MATGVSYIMLHCLVMLKCWMPLLRSMVLILDAKEKLVPDLCII